MNTKGMRLGDRRYGSSKGQAPLLSHTITIAFSIVLIIMVVTTLNIVKADYQNFIGREEILQTCLAVKSAIEQIYWPSEYQPNNNITMGSIEIDLPKRIADVNYRMRFQNNTLEIEAIHTLDLNQTCKIGFNASFIGSSNGGKTRITWTRYTNNTNVIEMSKV